MRSAPWRGITNDHLPLRNHRPSRKHRLAATYSMVHVMSEVKFERENRYIVIKRSDLKKVPVAYRSSMITPMFNLLPHLPNRECLVIESDWPEYEPVWQMIERRVTGNDIPAAETMGYSVVGNRYMIALTQQEILDHSQSYAGCMFELVARSALDAQRLRADTAEAELKKLREDHAALIEDRARFPDRPDFVGDMISAHIGNLKAGKESADNYARNWSNKLTVAEQRIADTTAKLQLTADMLDDDERGNRFAQVLQLAIAALNPKPEAESHE